MRIQFGIAALIGLMTASTATAETFYVPGACDPSKAFLEVQNKGTSEAALWIQLPTFPVQEIRYDLGGKSSLVIRGSEFLDRAQGFGIKTYSNSLSLKWSCEKRSYALSSWTSPESDYLIQPGTGDLQLLNLAPVPQNVKLEILNGANEILATHEIAFQKSYETQRVQFQFPTDSTTLRISGSGRLHTVLLDEQSQRQKTLVRAPAHLETPADQVYFLISTKEARPDESYVIGMQDPKMIATARQQILDPQLEKIIVAGISLGNQNVNRSFTGRDRSPYSWSVSRVDAFSDFALIDCDGSPDIVEENLMERIQQGGNICFWHYRVIRELSREEVMRGY